MFTVINFCCARSNFLLHLFSINIYVLKMVVILIFRKRVLVNFNNAITRKFTFSFVNLRGRLKILHIKNGCFVEINEFICGK